ncbi:MAG: DUF2157 domain-containing protein [Steroidobacteraceae bacterium]|nr:DUF2157 domain-containing protein [Steroidobacteraceae bacterium]
MQPAPKRDELDRVAANYSLDEAGVSAMLEIAGARPDRAAVLDFLARSARIGGVLSLAAGVVFFVAANWSRIAVFGRFALLELLLLAFVAIAFVKPPPRFVGRAAVLLAFVVSGALFALFGQTYQTGADIYELFLTWALLGLPFAIAGQWGVTSAAWVLVLNTAMLLFCGWHPRGGLLWLVFDGTRFTTVHALLFAAWLNLALWFVFEKFTLPAVPEWVRRLLLSCGFGFVTWVGIMGVVESNHLFGENSSSATAVVGSFATIAVVAWLALRRRRDVYPLAVAMGSFIIIVLCTVPRITNDDDALFFTLALWLIVSSTVAGKLLMTLMRRWRAETPA